MTSYRINIHVYNQTEDIKEEKSLFTMITKYMKYLRINITKYA